LPESVKKLVPFNKEIIDAEFASLRKSSAADVAKLLFCMQRFQTALQGENPSPALIKKFDDGLLELRHEKGQYKGRLLFYKASEPVGTEENVILVVFRKETQKTPTGVVEIALKRMRDDQLRRTQESR